MAGDSAENGRPVRKGLELAGPRRFPARLAGDAAGSLRNRRQPLLTDRFATRFAHPIRPLVTQLDRVLGLLLVRGSNSLDRLVGLAPADLLGGVRVPEAPAHVQTVVPMIPYSADDVDDPTRAFPVVTIGLIVVNFLVFFYELAQGDQLDKFINAFSLVPCEYTNQCSVYAGTPTPFWLTLFSSMFLHAGWDHILGNMLFLFVFGIHVERSMGAVRYLLFYLICGMGANALEILTSLGSNLPGLGASGAISGVLAGYLLMYPSSHIKTLIPLGFLFWAARVPAWIFIGLWFVLQLVEGLTTVSDVTGGGVAYFAHVGGFVTGLALVRLFAQSDRVDRLRAYHHQPV